MPDSRSFEFCQSAGALDALAAEPRWLAWREELRGGKPTKVPYSPRRGPGKSDDPATWGPKAEALAALPRLLAARPGSASRKEQPARVGGVGIVLGDLGADLHLAGIDLDSCLDGDGGCADWAAEIVECAASYAEVSPSGRGIKLYAYIGSDRVRPFLDAIGVKPKAWGARRGVPGEASGDHGPAVEVYASHRYFAVTGRRWGDLDRLATLDDAVLDRLARLIPPAARTSGSARKTRGGDGSRSAKALAEGARLRREGKTYDEMCEALRQHPDPEIRAWVREKGEAAGGRELRRIWQRAEIGDEEGEGVTFADFHAYMPQHSYIYAPAREPWPAASVNARLGPVRVGTDESGDPITISAAAWLDRNKPVEQMTWAPGLPMILADRLISEGGWIERQGVSCLNLYRPPLLPLGDPAQAGRWRAHVERVYPDDADHIIAWLAHRVQRPQDKLNHVLVLGGPQGIGKDTLIEPVKRAVGPWNVAEPSPVQLVGRFNGFAKSVILRINEARDLGEVDRYQFYEHLKVYAAAPPDVLRVDEKNLREHNVTNCCGVLITTNHKIGGMYLPADDRRHYIAWSILKKEDFGPNYWREMWGWYDRGGDQHVAAFLAQLDLAAFDPKAPPPKTPAFWEIVNDHRPAEDAELADILDLLGNPDAVTLEGIIARADDDFAAWLRDRRNRRLIPHQFDGCGYVPARNPAADDGLWKIRRRRMVVYARASLTFRDQLAAASALLDRTQRSV